MIRLTCLVFVLSAGSCLLLSAEEGRQDAGVPVPTPAGSTGSAARQEFEQFVHGLRAEALTRGISQTTVDLAFADLTPETVVVSRDRSQPENVQSLDTYLRQRLSARTIATAREMSRRHRTLLREIELKYGVLPSLMVAIWGLESNFGRFTGTYPTIRALVTLAYDNRRPLFRTELFHALEMVEKGLVTPSEMKGSWAGAMGQPQFMPSSFLKHAVDFDGNGRIDIWTSSADVFGSMANYLKNAGWHTGERWGREVAVSRATLDRIDQQVEMRQGACRAIREMTVPRPLDAWRTLGVTLRDGRPLPNAQFTASLVRGERRFFLVYRNYDAIVDYNCSNSYALAAGLLSDSIR
jgi:membrane-bound lytic murein transglycosylase B